VLKRRHLPPAPERGRHNTSWQTFLSHYKGELVACDFFTVETAWLKTLYVLFFIELGSRRVHLAAPRRRRAHGWHTKRASSVGRFRTELCPCASSFTIATPNLSRHSISLTSEDIRIIQTPVRAPNATAFAERWVRSVREECLDRLLIFRDRHLHRVLTEYVIYYNQARPHQGIAQQCPVPAQRSMASDGPIERRDILGGVLHDYHRRVA